MAGGDGVAANMARALSTRAAPWPRRRLGDVDRCEPLVEHAGRSYAGEPAGIVLEVEDGFTIYFAGDTNVFGDMSLIGRIYAPDVAVLPIGDHFTMGPREAAVAIELLGVTLVPPTTARSGC